MDKKMKKEMESKFEALPVFLEGLTELYQVELNNEKEDPEVFAALEASYQKIQEQGKNVVITRENVVFALHRYIFRILRDKFPFYGHYYQDMYQEAAAAILEYFPKYDKDKGALTTYFKTAIFHAAFVYVVEQVMHTTVHYFGMEKEISEYLQN